MVNKMQISRIRQKGVTAFLVLVIWSLASLATTQAVIINSLVDPLNDTSHFIVPVNNAGFVSNNLDGTVTMWRTNASVDASFIWGKSGTDERLNLATASTLKIDAVGAVNDGYWLAGVYLWDSGGGFLAEKVLQSDTQLTGLQIYNILNVTNGVNNVDSYTVWFRINPFDSSEVGFTFNSISAIPEPSVLGLFLIGGAVLASVRRRHAKRQS